MEWKILSIVPKYLNSYSDMVSDGVGLTDPPKCLTEVGSINWKGQQQQQKNWKGNFM